MAHSNLHPLYPQRAMTSSGTAVASQSLTVGATASGFATAFGSVTQLVTFDVQVSPVRVRWDGTDPTATSGHLLPVAGAYTWDKGMAAAAKFIRDTTATADAVVFVSELCGG